MFIYNLQKSVSKPVVLLEKSDMSEMLYRNFFLKKKCFFFLKKNLSAKAKIFFF